MSQTPTHGAAVAATARVARALLFAGLLANAAGHAFLLTALPPLGRQIGLADTQTGAILSLGAIGLLVAAPLWGFVAERWGRRPILLVGLATAATAPAIFGGAVDAALVGALPIALLFAVLVAVRLVQSLLTAGLLPAAQAYMADVTTAVRRTGGMGIMAAAFGLGGVLGAATLWATAARDPTLGFYLLAILTASIAAACAGRLPEPRRPAPESGAPPGRIAWTQVWPLFAVTFLGVTTYSIMQQVTGLRLQDQFGMTAQEAAASAGAALTATALSMVFAQGVLLQRLTWPPRRLLRLGAAGAAVVLAGLAVADSYALLVALLMGLGLALGLLLPANLAAMSLRTSPAAQGKIAGLNAVGQGLGMVAGPMLGASVYQIAPAAPYWMAAAMALCVAGLASLAKPDPQLSVSTEARMEPRRP
jgi:MFS family permease